MHPLGICSFLRCVVQGSVAMFYYYSLTTTGKVAAFFALPARRLHHSLATATCRQDLFDNSARRNELLSFRRSPNKLLDQPVQTNPRLISRSVFHEDQADDTPVEGHHSTTPIVPPPKASPNNKKRPKKRPKKDDDGDEQQRRPRIAILSYYPKFVAVNKPSGMTMHSGGGRHQRQHGTLQSMLKKQLSRKVWPIHRLDHRTSGALLVAFDSETSGVVHGALKGATKLYVAVVRGDWDRRFNTTRSILVDHPLKVGDEGILKDCQTRFSRLAVVPSVNDDNKPYAANGTNIDTTTVPRIDTACTLVSAQPLSGRTHQIRRHARQLGMPIIGDSQHGDSRVNRYWRPHLDRLALHCLCLTNLTVPTHLLHDDGKQDGAVQPPPGYLFSLDLTAPLPDDFRLFLNTTLDSQSLESVHDGPSFWNEAITAEPRLTTEWLDVRSGTLGIKKPWQS